MREALCKASRTDDERYSDGDTMPGKRQLMTRKRRRLILIGGALGVLAIAVALMLNAFRDSIVFFNSPSDVAEKHIAPGTRIGSAAW